MAFFRKGHPLTVSGPLCQQVVRLGGKSVADRVIFSISSVAFLSTAMLLILIIGTALRLI